MANPELDEATYTQLVHDCAAAAWRAARRVTADDGLASDAVQETFLRLIDGRTDIAKLGAKGDIQQGLVATAVRVALDQRRSGARRRARETRHVLEQNDERAPSASASVTDQELLGALRSALAKLPEKLRLPLELRYHEGLPFAAIGRALGFSESTAHERVNEGQSLLRRGLERAGFGASIAAPERAFELLHFAGGSAAPPSALTAGLLQLAAPTTAVGTGSALATSSRAGEAAAASGSASSGLSASAGLLWLVGLGAVIALGLAWAGRGMTSPATSADPSPSSAAHLALAPESASTREDTAVAASGLSTSADPRTDTAARTRASAQDPETAFAARPFVLTGRVSDPLGHGVPGATVRATTVERDGKFARWSGAAIADDAGRYRLEVPFAGALAGLASAPLTLEAGHLGFVLRTATNVEARPAGVAEQDVVVAVAPGERAGDFTLDLLVRDAEGAPVAGALVDLSHVAPRDLARVADDVSFSAWSSSAHWLHLAESKGRTGPDGRARLAGKRLGPKSLWIEPTDGYAPMRTSLTIGAEGAQGREVIVAPGHTLNGRVCWVGGEALDAASLGALSMHVVLEPNRWRSVVPGADGTFQVGALAAGPLTLRIQQGWNASGAPTIPPSDATLEVLPGDALQVLELKRRDDPRDVGVHDAELHGVALDDATGEPLPLGTFDLFVWPLWQIPEGDLEHDLLANLIHAPMVQRAAGPGPVVEIAEFHEVGLAPGAYMVQASRRGVGSAILGPIVLGEREVRAGLALRLGPTASVDVTVVDANGAPLAGVWVFATGNGPYSKQRLESVDREYAAIAGRGTFSANGGRRTDDEGRAQLTGLPPGLHFRVAAVHPAYTPWVSKEELVASGAKPTTPTAVRLAPR